MSILDVHIERGFLIASLGACVNVQNAVHTFSMKTTDDFRTRRLELRLSESEADSLNDMREQTKAASNAEVVRQALKEYESLLNKRKA